MLEDMSKINHIFCDKTGTLTKNEMIFRILVIKNSSFRVENNDLDLKNFSK